MENEVVGQKNKQRKSSLSHAKVGNGVPKQSPQNGNLSNHYIEHTLDVSQLAQTFSNTGINVSKTKESRGLNPAKAEGLLELNGPNKLPSPKEISDLRLFISQFCNLLWILMAATSTISLVGHFLDSSDKTGLWVAMILYAMIVVMCSMSFWQEREARKVVSGFKNLLPQSCSVIRGGNETVVSAEDLVVGDLLKISSGSKVAADARVIYCNQLKLETSSITGESEPIEFQAEAVDKSVTIFESRNVAFNGSYCVDGEGLGVVIRTGVNTVIGQIASMTTNQPVKKSHLEHQIKLFVKLLTFLAISIGTTVFVIGGLVHHWEHITLLLVTAFSVCAVGMIPEGMPATVTSILTLVARSLAKRNVYLKRLDIVEALGSANIIASDKTGTLTKNKMTVTDVWYSDEYVTEIDTHLIVKTNPRRGSMRTVPSGVKFPLNELVVAMSVCNRASFDDGRSTKINMPCNEEDVKRNLNNLFQIICSASGISTEQIKSRSKSRRRFAQIQTRKAVGSPSEVALIQYAEQFVDVHEFRQKFNIVFEIPFNSRRKFHLMIVKEADEEENGSNRCLLLMKGAAEILIEKCSTIMTSKGEEPMTHEKMQEFKIAYDTYAENGRRVIGFAQKSMNQVSSINFSVEEGNVPMQDLVFIGICAIMDPPRDETEMAIRQCKEAGLKVFMVTGDHHTTATAIAKQIGLVNENKKGSKKDWDVVKGEEIAGLKDYDWDYILAKKYLVFARTTPEQKLKIVKECQKRKQIIAMTGDGVNDAPALKKSNIGIGMGSGSDVAKEAADIVLVDDNFSSIVGAVEEGRLMFDNIKKLMVYILTHTFPEVWAIVINLWFGMPAGTTSLMILSIDLGTEILPGIAMCWEPLEGDVMRRPPRKEGNTLIGKALIFYCYGYTAHIQVLSCFLAYCFVFWSYDIKIADLMFTLHQWKPDSPDFISNGHVFTAAQQVYINQQACSAWQIGVVFGQVFHVFSARTLRQSLFSHGFFSNKLIIWAVIAEILILCVYVYMPGVNTFLGGAPVSWHCWAIVAAFGVFVFCYNELRKYCIRRWPKNSIVRIFKF